MSFPAPHLLFLLMLAVAVLAIADYLVEQWRDRRARRQRLEARINELKRDARRRMAERPTMNTRSDAP